MKAINSLDIKMCVYQAELFKASKDQTACSSKIFIRRFMNSELAHRMDNIGFLFESTTITDAISEIEMQYGVSSYGKEKFTYEELYWIGYIYRYWVCVSAQSSRQIYKRIKPELLRKLYFPYHSLDPAQAIERIMEESGESLSTGIDDIAKGVNVLRMVRKKRAFQAEKILT